VGLLSMIMTSVLGSGAWEKERRGRTHALRNNTKLYPERSEDLLFGGAPACHLMHTKSFQDPARFAPVADGTCWPSMPRLMRQQGKSTASFASAGRPNSSEKCSSIQGCYGVAQHGYQVDLPRLHPRQFIWRPAGFRRAGFVEQRIAATRSARPRPQSIAPSKPQPLHHVGLSAPRQS